jgi:HD-GYP domain-containing protein (c-di-GMP phosphodiesterase class II)
MGRQSPRRFQLQLAILTLGAMAVIGVIFSLPHAMSLHERAENNAGNAVSSTLAPPLAASAAGIDPQAPDREAIAAFTNDASALLSERIERLRLWSVDGELLASTDGSAPELAGERAESLHDASRGETNSFKAGGPEGAVLASFVPVSPDLVIEIEQDYTPIGTAISDMQRTLALFWTGAMVVAFLLVQAIAWLVTRGLRGEYERLLYLHRTGQAVRSSLDLADVMSQLARDATVFTHGQLGLATLRDEDSDDLILQASYESKGDASSQHHRPVEEWFLRRCAVTGETVTAGLDQSPQEVFLGTPPDRLSPVILLCAPIALRDRTIGVLTVVRDAAQGRFTAAEVQLVEEMAGQTAMAVEQAILFAKVRRSANQLELSYDTTLRVLMAALDAKDEVTQGHSERVARLTVAVAKEMNIPQEKLVDVERGALLHDVGKIGVPDQVLQKPNALDEAEWEAMQKHPLLAGLMVSKVDFLEGALPILMYHHEKFDGTGYPFGLAGDAIPLEARIFAVVDAYDAITSDRPYRAASEPKAALDEIQNHAGRQFDPRVVKAFVRLMSRSHPAIDLHPPDTPHPDHDDAEHAA